MNHEHQILIVFPFLLLSAACTPGIDVVSPTPTSQEATATLTNATSSPTRLPSSTPLPTNTTEPGLIPKPTTAPARPIFAPPTPDEIPLDAVTSFVDFPGNKAKGETAPDFSAHLLGGDTFTLSEWRDTYLLVLPTVVGCGPCMANLEEITQIYPAYQDTNLDVLILDIYAPDSQDVWQFYADLFPEVGFLWGVVDSMDFVMDYNLTSLGDVVLISPEREILFWSRHILRAKEYRALIDLIVESSNTSDE